MIIEYTRHNKFASATVALLLVRILLALSDPGTGFGRGYGLQGFLAVFGILILSVGVSAGVWWLVLPRLMTEGRRMIQVFAAGVFVTSILVNFGMFLSADADWDLSRHLVTNQVEYFCVHNFHRERCVEKINHCPACVLEIDRWKRDKISDKLKAFRVHYEAVQKQAARQPASR